MFCALRRREPDGNISGARLVISDLTEIRDARASLARERHHSDLIRQVARAAEDRFKMVIETAVDAIITIDRHARRPALVRILRRRARGRQRVHAAGAVDVLLVDYGLPDGKGDALAREARALLPDVPIAYMSGYPDLAPDPPAPILEKPFGLDAMSVLVRSLVSR
jgi:CheY-like chemotaxis protein